MSIVWEETRQGLWHARLLGKLLSRNNSPEIDQGLMWEQQANHHNVIMAPPKHKGQQYTCAYHPGDSNVIVYTDSILLCKPGQSAAIATADCGTTIMACKKSGLVALVHTGRDQLMCREIPKEPCSIVTETLMTMLQEGARMDSISVLNVAHIAPEYFPHKNKEDEYMLWQQAKLWSSPDIIKDSEAVTLCLHTLITAQLFEAGLRTNQVARVRIDPYTSPDLYSKREANDKGLSEEKQGSNVFVLFKE